ncbi:hypothetical protein [Puniceibacterium confluentis]|uniref:hypothetical protein n=1 Tax=Puniceibacterium confluentis TaxID=1958944 RepID=UPI0011B5162A|nr:hypothetical protein [Puniceibacterium confluentis]
MTRRSLNATEIRVIDMIMRARKLSQSQVMDELGLPRLDPSLWMARRRGTTVGPDMLDRLLMWFKANRAVWGKL